MAPANQGLEIYIVQTMGTGQFQMPVSLLCTYIEYSALRLSHLPQRALYFIGLSLESLVQICLSLSPVRTHQNTYPRTVFCERLYIDPNHNVVNQILANG